VGDRGRAGRAAALVASALQVVAAFLPWTGDGRLALDLGLGQPQPTVALVLLALAAIAAVPAIVSDAGWPRTMSAVGTGVLGLLWLANGPDGAITSGIAVALTAVALHLLAAAIASGPLGE